MRKVLKRLGLAIRLKVGTTFPLAAARCLRSGDARSHLTRALRRDGGNISCSAHVKSDIRVGWLLRHACVATFWRSTGTSQAQFFRNGAVGGVKIDADGVVSNPEVGELKELQAAWQKGLKKCPPI